MKRKLMLMLAAVAAFSSGAILADEKTSDRKDLNTQASRGQTHSATGVVKKMNPATGQVTLQHGPVKSLNWPAMTMAFDVRDKSLLDKLQIGKKVQFQFVHEGAKYVVTGVK